MANIDWTEEEKKERPTIMPGDKILVEVDTCEEKTSKKGDPYFNLSLVDIESRWTVCWDVIMLAGRGRGIGQSKLIELGVPSGTESIMAESLEGRRVWVSLESQPYKDKKTGEMREGLKVELLWDKGSPGWKAGYWRDDPAWGNPNEVEEMSKEEMDEQAGIAKDPAPLESFIEDVAKTAETPSSDIPF